jgi:hypothetical protein
MENAVENKRERPAAVEEPRQLDLAHLDRLVPEIAAVDFE